MLSFGFSGGISTYTAATAPLASAIASGTRIRISDVGIATGGSVFVSNGTYYEPADSNIIVLGRSSVQVADAASGSDLIYAKVAIPAKAWATNTHIRVRAGFSCTSSVNSKTYRAHISANNYAIGGTVVSGTIMAAATGQNSVASHVFGAHISNRNSISAQAGLFSEMRNQGAISVGTATATLDTSAATTYIYITAQKATAGETVTLEDYIVELM
jgi:hypothetical protein